MQVTTDSEAQTAKAAQDFATELKGGEIIALYGTLGMGKTVFARSLIRALTNDKALEVPSPTFTLLQTYDSDKGPIYHYDCYRLEDPEEIYELGWEDALSDAITLIEWPEKLGTLLPKDTLRIYFSADSEHENQRSIILKGSNAA